MSASATQMLRQSLLLFATALAVVVYGKPLNRLHFVGLAGCLVRIQRAPRRHQFAQFSYI